jgi:hypothetical protein
VTAVAAGTAAELLDRRFVAEAKGVAELLAAGTPEADRQTPDGTGAVLQRPGEDSRTDGYGRTGWWCTDGWTAKDGQTGLSGQSG